MKTRTIHVLTVATLAACGLAQKTCGGRVKLENIWKALVRLHDKDGDGRITKKEYTRGDKQFTNHDRNWDGVITADDFPTGRFWNGFAPGIARRADRNRDGVVTKKEWKAMTSMLDRDGDGEITMVEFGKIAPPEVAGKPKIVALSFDQDGDGKIEVSDFNLLFVDLDRDSDGELAKNEMRRNQSLLTRSKIGLPKLGKTAPDFALPRLDDAKSIVRLSSFKSDRPVALIFGSYT
jgi:Ca2+-binding EF-hand superfamily protein